MTNVEGRTMDIIVGEFSSKLGCMSVPDTGIVHVGVLFDRITACGQPLGDTILSREITVTCQECIEEYIHRDEHPETKSKAFGIVTRKKD